MPIRKHTHWLRHALAAAGLLLGLGAAEAAAPAEFYKGRQIVLLLSTDAGGGYGSYANALLPYLAKHIPGQPRVIIQYMPGAGGIRAMNYIYAAAPKDGTVMAMVHATSPYAPLFGIAAAKYVPGRMNWIGSLDDTSGICVAWGTSGIKTWEDVLTKSFVVGSSGAGSQMETFPMMVNKLFGTKMKVISGYKGGNEVFLAMERGEVHGRCGSLVSSITSTRPDWLPQKKISVPFQVALERNPLFPDSPAIAEFAKDAHTKRVLQLVLAHMAMDKPLVMPPGVPPERVAAIRAGFHAAMNDPAFIADTKRQRILVREVSGEKVAGILATAYAMPPDVVKAATEAMDFSGGG
jgi:tripartite-type tricarboxylate transporter receptor subunit TctC